MDQTAVSAESANPGARQSSPPPSSSPFKHRNIAYILKADPFVTQYLSPDLRKRARKQMAAQVLDALFEHRLDLLSLFTDDEQIAIIFKRKDQRGAACAIRLYGLMLILEEVKHLDDQTRQRLLDVLKVVETDFADLLNPEEIPDLKQKILSP